MLQQHTAVHLSGIQTNRAVDNPGLSVFVHTIAVPSREYLLPEIEKVLHIYLDRSMSVYIHAALQP